MLASRVGVLGAVLAAAVLTLELGGAVAWQHRMTAIDLRVADELAQSREIMRLERQLADLDRQLATANAALVQAIQAARPGHPSGAHGTYNDQLIVPNRAGY